MRNHGVFTAGDTPSDALTAAMIVEHSAKISYLAELYGNPRQIPVEEVERLHKMFLEHYGQ